MRLAILSFAFLFAGNVFGAPVVTTNTVELNRDAPPLRDVQLTVKQTPLGGITSFWFDLSLQVQPNFIYDIALSNFIVNLDEGSDWYLVREGDIFTNATIDEPAFVALGGATKLIDFSYHSGASLSSPSFYLGFATSKPGTFYPRNTFGWVHLKMPTVLGTTWTVEILDSATAYDSSGIVIGSLQALPEPSSLLLIGSMGLLGYACCRRAA